MGSYMHSELFDRKLCHNLLVITCCLYSSHPSVLYVLLESIDLMLLKLTVRAYRRLQEAQKTTKNSRLDSHVQSNKLQLQLLVSKTDYSISKLSMQCRLSCIEAVVMKNRLAQSISYVQKTRQHQREAVGHGRLQVAILAV